MLDNRFWELRPAVFGAFERYVLRGVVPGDFLTAVLANDLKEACGRADHHNQGRLWAITCFMINQVPSESQGSISGVEEWAAHAGLLGKGLTVRDYKVAEIEDTNS